MWLVVATGGNASQAVFGPGKRAAGDGFLPVGDFLHL
jgi:hypothetical protein